MCDMEGIEEVLVSNGFSSLEKVNSEKVAFQDGGTGDLAEEVLEGLEEYWEDINDRLMISRMVSDSVIKGMVSAVEQEAAEKVASKELELAKVMRFHEVGTGRFENNAHSVRRYGSFSCYLNAYVEHEKLRVELHDLRNLASEQFEKAKKEIGFARVSSTMKKIGSASELVGLGGILHEKQYERWIHVNKTLEHLKEEIGGVYEKMDGVLLSSKSLLCESRKEQELSDKLEGIVIETVLKGLQKELEENLWEQNAKFLGIQNVSWLEKFNAIIGLGTQLDAIVKSLSVLDAGLASHGSHDLEHLSSHVAPRENGALGASNIHVAESYDFQQLKHMSNVELVNYFNGIITKLKRDHESAMHQKTEEYFRLKREYLKLKEKGPSLAHRKEEEFDMLRKKIPGVISKLEDFVLENERFPALTNNLESIEKLKNKLDCLLSENCRLRDSLTDKKNEIKCLESQLSGVAAKLLDQSLTEEKLADLKSKVEDSSMEASLAEEVYKCALREQIALTRCDTEDSNMEILSNAAIPSETEDSDFKSLIMQGISEIIFREVIKDTELKFSHLHREVHTDKEIIKCLDAKLVEKETELRLEVEEKDKLRQEILDLGTAIEQKEMTAMDLSDSLLKEREQFEKASIELVSLRDYAREQEILLTERNTELESVRSQLSEATELIEVGKVEMHKLKQIVDQTKDALTEANKERNKAAVVTQEMFDKVVLSEAREEKLKQEMEMAVSGISKMFENLQCKESTIEENSLRLESLNSQLKDIAGMANALRRTKLVYKQNVEKKCADLKMAEAEVDLLGDEVENLLGLLGKVYIALDHYSPVLKHYPGIVEILELVRRELSGESSKVR